MKRKTCIRILCIILGYISNEGKMNGKRMETGSGQAGKEKERSILGPILTTRTRARHGIGAVSTGGCRAATEDETEAAK